MNTLPKTIQLCGANCTFQVPATAADYDSVAGAGECVAKTIAFDIYRSTATAARNAAAKALEKSSGHKIGKTKKGDKEVTETADAYFDRLKADESLTPRITQEDVQRAFDAVVGSEVTFENTALAPSNRSAIGSDWMEAAQGAVDVIKAGKGTAEQVVATLRTKLPGAVWDDPSDVEGLARLLRDFDKASRAVKLFA